MKKKLSITLLSFTLTSGVVCGCGNKVNQSMAAEPHSAVVEDS